jgi:DNA-binding NarL/FixJ family response regulator
MKTTPTTPPRPNTTTKSPTARKIFLVDDHPVTRQGIAMLIDQDPDFVVCGEADNGPLAVELIPKAAPDLAIVDITLKTTSGIELLKDLKAILPDLPVLVMSMHDESLYAERALRAGARGYVMKHEPSEVVMAAIRRVLDGELHLSDRVKEKMLSRLAGGRKDNVSFSMDMLSDREMEVFQLIGNGFSTRQIAERLNLSVKTIDSYREHLKLKLRLESGAHLVHHAIQWMRSESIV